MGELEKALGDISSIRRQMADTTVFRGYGPATLAATSALAAAAAELQAFVVHDPWRQVRLYLWIWGSAAVLGAALGAAGVVSRTRRMHSGLSNEMLGMAVDQFLPSLGVGVLLGIVLIRCAPAALWMLPGLLQIVFSLGVFSSCRFLPRPMQAAAAWYLLTGLACLALGDARAFSPWAMGLPFAGGQLLIAAILFFAHAKEGVEGADAA